jgi:hypothetical protein
VALMPVNKPQRLGAYVACPTVLITLAAAARRFGVGNTRGITSVEGQPLAQLGPVTVVPAGCISCPTPLFLPTHARDLDREWLAHASLLEGIGEFAHNLGS